MTNPFNQKDQESRTAPGWRTYINRTTIPVIICVLAVGGIIIWTLFPQPDARTQPAPTDPATVVAPTNEASTSEEPTHEATASPPPAEPSPEPSGNDENAGPPDGWDAMAKAWATAFVNTDGGKAGWMKRMRPLVTDYIYEGYESTDIKNLPHGPITNMEIKTPAGHQTEAYIEYDSGEQVAIMVQYDNGWRIAKTRPIK